MPGSIEERPEEAQHYEHVEDVPAEIKRLLFLHVIECNSDGY